MLFEIRRTCLFTSCPVCNGKIFRYLLEGTYQSEEYGTTAGLKVWDRCEECKEVFKETDVTLNIGGISDQLYLLFASWEQRVLGDEDFAKGVQDLFASVGGGGWIANPRQSTG